MVSKLELFDRVRHDFSGTEGQLIGIDEGHQTYTHLVRWDDGKEDWYTKAVLEKIDPDHTDDPAKKVEPAKTLSVDEILREVWLDGAGLLPSLTRDQAKAYLIELVERLPELQGNWGYGYCVHSMVKDDCTSCGVGHATRVIKQALIKAIEGDNG